MRIALAQLNPLVGDLVGNAERILEACHQAHQQQADLVVTPELALWGYPPAICCSAAPGFPNSRA